MNIATDPFWSLPGPARWLRQSVDKAIDTGLVGLGVPSERGPPRLMEAVKEELLGRDILRVHNVRSKADGRSIVSRLASSAGMSGAAFRTLEGFLEARETNGAAFLVENATPDEWMQLATFLKLFVRARGAAQIPLAPLLVVNIPPDLPRSDVTFTFGKLERQWCGVVSTFDMRVFVRGMIGDAQDFAGRIREETILELAGYDVEFAASLCDAPPHDLLNPVPMFHALVHPAYPPPRWSTGLVDEVDGEMFEHSLSAAFRKDWKLLERRVWRAHTKALMSLIADVRSLYYRLYRQVLSSRLPFDASTGDYSKIINDINDLELSHMIKILSNRCSTEDIQLLSIFNTARNYVAHYNILTPDLIKLISNRWLGARAMKADDSWRWPRCDQRLVLLVGPRRAGKSAHARRSYAADEIISFDALRVKLTGSIQTVGGQDQIFAEARRRIRQRVSRGENAVVDAKMLTQDDRLAIVDAVPDDITVVYEIIDRPLEEKRQNLDPRTRGSVETEAEVFNREIANILRGDGRKNVSVRDLRRAPSPNLVAAK